MGSGGGSGKTYSEVSQTSSNLPEYAEPYYKDLLARSGFETAQPYETYNGQRVADFSPMEQEAMARYGELGMSGNPEELQAAGSMMYGVGQGQANINVPVENTYQKAGYIGKAGDYENTQRDSGYTAGNYNMGFEAGNMYGDSLSPYQDQYMQDVVDIQKREAARQADIRNQQTGLDAAGMGSLGGYRDAILRAENERNLTQEMSDIQKEGSQQAFLNAQQAYEADRQARAQQEQFGQSAFGLNEGVRQAQEQLGQGQFGLNSANNQYASQASLAKYNAYEQAKQQAAQLGLSAAEIEQAGQIAAANVNLGYDQNRLAAAQGMADIAGMRQAMEMERLGAMQNAGAQQRGMYQTGLDTAYQDFMNQQNWGKEQLAFYSNMLQGTPIKPGETTVTNQNNGGSLGQQLLGGGIAGLALANQYKG